MPKFHQAPSQKSQSQDDLNDVFANPPGPDDSQDDVASKAGKVVSEKDGVKVYSVFEPILNKNDSAIKRDDGVEKVAKTLTSKPEKASEQIDDKTADDGSVALKPNTVPTVPANSSKEPNEPKETQISEASIPQLERNTPDASNVKEAIKETNRSETDTEDASNTMENGATQSKVSESAGSVKSGNEGNANTEKLNETSETNVAPDEVPKAPADNATQIETADQTQKPAIDNSSTESSSSTDRQDNSEPGDLDSAPKANLPPKDDQPETKEIESKTSIVRPDEKNSDKPLKSINKDTNSESGTKNQESETQSPESDQKSRAELKETTQSGPEVGSESDGTSESTESSPESGTETSPKFGIETQNRLNSIAEQRLR